MADEPRQPGPPIGTAAVISNAVNALRPYGPTPIVAVVLGGLGLTALSVGAPPLATVVLVAIAFGAYFWGQERKAEWARRELQVRYDGFEKHETLMARVDLERRLQQPGNQAQGNLGGGQGVRQ